MKKQSAGLFLKIHRLLISYALLRPHIRIDSKRPAMKKPSADTQLESLRALHTSQFVQELEAVEYQSADGRFAISALWPKPDANLSVPSMTCAPAPPLLRFIPALAFCTLQITHLCVCQT